MYVHVCVCSYEELKAAKSGIDGPVSDIQWSAKEVYLSDAEFKTVFGVSREEFNKFPGWKKTAEKKRVGLF